MISKWLTLTAFPCDWTRKSMKDQHPVPLRYTGCVSVADCVTIQRTDVMALRFCAQASGVEDESIGRDLP
jgi:hypothetical protein